MKKLSWFKRVAGVAVLGSAVAMLASADSAKANTSATFLKREMYDSQASVTWVGRSALVLVNDDVKLAPKWTPPTSCGSLGSSSGALSSNGWSSRPLLNVDLTLDNARGVAMTSVIAPKQGTTIPHESLVANVSSDTHHCCVDSSNAVVTCANGTWAIREVVAEIVDEPF